MTRDFQAFRRHTIEGVSGIERTESQNIGIIVQFYLIDARLKILKCNYLDLFDGLTVLKILKRFGQTVMKNRYTPQVVGNGEISSDNFADLSKIIGEKVMVECV